MGAVRLCCVVLACAVTATVPSPVPPCGATESQLAPPLVVHAQVLAEASTVTGCVPPAAGRFRAPGVTANVHGAGAPSWVTATARPAIVTVAVRACVPVLGATANWTSSSPRPVVRLSVIQSTGLDAVQSQLPRDASTLLVRVPPPAGTVCAAGATAKVQDGTVAAWVTVTAWPAMVTVAERGCSAAFSAMLTVTCASPWPLARSTVIQGTGLAASQAQAARLVSI